MKYETTKVGVKIYDGDTHIKTAPKKYLKVLERITFPEEGPKFLTNQERLFLEAELIREKLKASLERIHQLAAERLEGAIAVDCFDITVRGDKKDRCELLFDNGEIISCSSTLHRYGSGKQINRLY